MLSASYNTPSSKWTEAFDLALKEWEKITNGDANFRVNLQFDAPSQYLASNLPQHQVPIGSYQGSQMLIPQAAARFQGYDGAGPDLTFRINESYPFSFGRPQAGKYSFPEIAEHELGHGLVFTAGLGKSKTPWDIFKDRLPSGALYDSIHFDDDSSLMYHKAFTGETQQANGMDIDAIRASGIPTSGDDKFWLIDSAKIDGGGGNDTAIWLKAFDDYNANLSRIGRLEMLGDNPLNAQQQSIYKLYRAGLGRDPDYAGFKWWNQNGGNLQDMAKGFYGSNEFAPIAAKATNRDYIGALYQNILKRPAEQAGVDYWDSRTDLDRAGLLANIAVSPENKIGTVGFSL